MKTRAHPVMMEGTDSRDAEGTHDEHGFAKPAVETPAARLDLG